MSIPLTEFEAGDMNGAQVALFVVVLVMMSAATWRIGRLVALDTIWEGWRDRFKGWLTGGTKLRVWKLKVEELIRCPFCITGWTSIIVVAATNVIVRFPLIGLQWFAAWTGGLLIWGLIDSDEGPRMEHGKK